MKKKKYFGSGFSRITEIICSDLKKEYDFEFKDFTSTYCGLIKSRNFLKKKYKTKEIYDYDVVHLGTWEVIISFKKVRKDQLFIAHAHGFFVGINFDATIREIPFVKRQISKALKFFLDNKMKNKLREADMFYVSTPNMLEHAKKIRSDALWLPNPIDVKNFNPNGKKAKLEGNPSVFFPTRFHAFKNPLYGVNIFNKILEKYPEAKLHIVNYGGAPDPLRVEFKFKLLKKGTYIEHKMMPHDKLAEFYRGADLVLGQFNDNLGNLSLVELEAMASGAPIVTLDKYERDMPLDKCEEIAFKIIEDKKFKSKFIKDNLDYVRRVHSDEAVAKLHKKNLHNLIKKTKFS